MPRSARVLAPLRAALAAAFLAAILGAGLVPVAHARTLDTATPETMEAQILGWVNDARIAKGLVPLRPHAQLSDLAGDRAAVMASTGTLSHTVAGCLQCQLDGRHIQWYLWGEDIGYTGYAWGDAAAWSLFTAYRNSSIHWSLLMSSKFNYVGLGVAYRTADKTTWNSIVFTESVDQSRPWVRRGSSSLSGTSVTWRWSGGDTQLQTHTAGLRNFDVQYRVDSGSWSTIRSGTTATMLTLTGRLRGHYYGLRIRSRDWRGIVSGYSAEMRVWVP